MARRALLLIASATVAVQVAGACSPFYGWFVDELYYAACARRLAWGYVDHPPLSIAVLAATRAVLGGSLVAARLPAALGVAVGSAFLVVGSFYSMNAIEVLLWTAIAVSIARTLARGDARGWIVTGALFGLAMMNKHTSVLFGGALVVGIAATPARGAFATRWPWIGAAVALAILAPNLAWQATHGFPSLEFYRNAQQLKNVPTPPLKALANQILLVGPGVFPIAALGAGTLAFARGRRPHERALGIAFVLLFVTAVFSGSSRPDRIRAAYPIALAGGAVAVERACARRAWLGPAAVALVVVPEVAVATILLPLLPPARARALATKLGLVPQVERGKTGPLPQWLADRIVWRGFVDDVVAVIDALPPDDRARVVVWGGSYGQAGAVEELAGRPMPVISRHNSYWMWSAGLEDPDVVVGADVDPALLRRFYADVSVARGRIASVCEAWPSLRWYE